MQPVSPPPRREFILWLCGRRRPIHPLPADRFPKQSDEDDPRDGILRIPCGGGYRILRCPGMLDSEE